MRIELPTLNEYLGEKRPVNFRPLVTFTLFFVWGILVSGKASPLFYILYCAFIAFLAVIAHANSYKNLLICLLGFIAGIMRVLINNATSNALNSLMLSFAEFFTPIRDALTIKTAELFGDAADVINAILWGDKTHLMQYQRDVFANAGIAHVLALSGLHVSFFVALFYKLFPKHFRKTKLIFCSLFLLAYCCIAAFPPSLMRASIMTALYLTASALFMHHDRPTSIALAALIILFITPSEIFDLGFQLSFASIIGILLVCRPIENFLKRYISNYLASAVAVTLSATLGVLPISLHSFHTFATYTLIGNIFLLPFVTFLVITAFFAVIISFILPPIASLLVPFASFAYDCIYTFSSFISSLPYSLINMEIPLFVSLCIYGAMFVSSQYYLRPSYIKLPVIAVISVLALISCLVI